MTISEHNTIRVDHINQERDEITDVLDGFSEQVSLEFISNNSNNEIYNLICRANQLLISYDNLLDKMIDSATYKI